MRPSSLVLPLFVKEGIAEPQPVASMPGVVQHTRESLRKAAAEVGHDTVLMADLCLDEYTDHGHCGLVTATGEVDNDATLERYASIAVAQAAAPGRLPAGPGRGEGRPA